MSHGERPSMRVRGRASAVSSASSRSAGVVTFRFGCARLVQQHRPALALDQHRLVGRRRSGGPRRARRAARRSGRPAASGLPTSPSRLTVAAIDARGRLLLQRVRHALRGDHARRPGVLAQRRDRARRSAPASPAAAPRRGRRRARRRIAGLASAARAFATDSERVSPPATTFAPGFDFPPSSSRTSSSRPGGAATTTASIDPAAAKARRDQASIGRPATRRAPSAPPARSLSPEPAAAMIACAMACAPCGARSGARRRRRRLRRSAPRAGRRGTPRRLPRPCRART